MITDVVSYDDLGMSDRLNIPILSADPDVSHLYSNKSGAKRIFTSAEVRLSECSAKPCAHNNNNR